MIITRTELWCRLLHSLEKAKPILLIELMNSRNPWNWNQSNWKLFGTAICSCKQKLLNWNRKFQRTRALKSLLRCQQRAWNSIWQLYVKIDRLQRSRFNRFSNRIAVRRTANKKINLKQIFWNSLTKMRPFKRRSICCLSLTAIYPRILAASQWSWRRHWKPPAASWGSFWMKTLLWRTVFACWKMRSPTRGTPARSSSCEMKPFNRSCKNLSNWFKILTSRYLRRLFNWTSFRIYAGNTKIEPTKSRFPPQH